MKKLRITAKAYNAIKFAGEFMLTVAVVFILLYGSSTLIKLLV